jgi:starch synthase
MRIGIVASEAYPFAKTGGLADVAGSLFKIFGKLNNETFLFMPLYKNTKAKFTDLEFKERVSVQIGERTVYANIYIKTIYPNSTAVFVGEDQYFDRAELYGVNGVDYEDNAERFGFFDKAVLEAIKALNLDLDVLHLNDWQTGLIPLFVHDSKQNIKTVFTIHNLAYQGSFDLNVLELLHIDIKYFTMDGIEFYGKISFLKAGILYSDYITTVSPTYSKEILSKNLGERLEGVLNARKSKLTGILNGIDYDVWNPENDKNIFLSFDTKNLNAKEQNKKAFLNEIGISNSQTPLFGMVTRIASQKGLDILVEALKEFLPKGNAAFVILGTGDKNLENAIKTLESLYPDKVKAIIGFDEKIAHKIYASSDFFLMPSKYEPCGLGQLIALRYGSLPVVNEVGGLKDTVDNYNEYTHCGNGISFSEYSKEALLDAINRACLIFKDASKLSQIREVSMNCNFSWENSANKYIDLFKKL